MAETTEQSSTPTGGENAPVTGTEPAVDFFDSFMSESNQSAEVSTETQTTPEAGAGDEGSVSGGEGTQGVDEASALREEIGRMAAVMASHGITFLETTEGEQTPEGTTTETQTPAPTQVQTASAPTWGPTVEVSDEDFQASLENKAVLEKLLTTVRDQAVERTVQSIPQLVTSMIKQQLYLNEMSREFYQANEDLAGMRPFVGVVANEIASKNPGLKPEEVLDRTAVEVRKRLQMKVNTAMKTSPENPGLPQTGNRQRVNTPNLSGLEKDLTDLMEVR